MTALAVVWIGGMIAAVPALRWWARDLAPISRRTWYWTGYSRRHWQWGVLIGWVAGGWPALLIILVWFRGGQRRELLAETESERLARQARHTVTDGPGGSGDSRAQT